MFLKDGYFDCGIQLWSGFWTVWSLKILWTSRPDVMSSRALFSWMQTRYVISCYVPSYIIEIFTTLNPPVQTINNTPIGLKNPVVVYQIEDHADIQFTLATNNLKQLLQETTACETITLV